MSARPAKPDAHTPAEPAKTPSAPADHPVPHPSKTRLKDKQRPQRIYATLLATYPDAHCALNHRNAFELLVATILSAQCTDERVNMVTPALFKKYPSPAALAAAKPAEIEELIKSTGFFRSKAKSIQGAAKLLSEKHRGEIPDSMDALLELPGVARKTANVVLGNAFGKNEGMVVDTHVGRLSQRLAFTTHSDPSKIEQDLMRLFPRDTWSMLAHLLIFHGRQICYARKPRCGDCPLAADCPKIGVRVDGKLAPPSA
jgi:endonuclease III